MTIDQNVEQVTADELYEYINVLETHTTGLEARVDELWTENRNMRRSIAAYKANATIRRNRREAVAA